MAATIMWTFSSTSTWSNRRNFLQEFLFRQRNCPFNFFVKLWNVLCCILVPRARGPSGLWLGSRALYWSKTGSLRFTHLPSKLANLIGWELETNTQRMLRKLSLTRALDLNHRPGGSWALGTRVALLNLSCSAVKWPLFLNGVMSKLKHWNLKQLSTCGYASINSRFFKVPVKQNLFSDIFEIYCLKYVIPKF